MKEGIKRERIWSGLRQQIYLWDEAFVKQTLRKARIRGDAPSIPRSRRRMPAPPIASIANEHPGRNDAIAAAYETGAYSDREIADYFGIHLATVGRVVRSRMQ